MGKEEVASLKVFVQIKNSTAGKEGKENKGKRRGKEEKNQTPQLKVKK